MKRGGLSFLYFKDIFCALPHVTLDLENIGIFSLIRLSQKKTHAVDANTLGIKEKWKAIAQILNFL